MTNNTQKKESNRISNIYMAVLYVCFGVFSLLVVMSKKDFHIDEIYSYGLANNVGSIEMEFEQGVMYEPAKMPYDEYLCAQTGQRLEYANVFTNQKADVHPPLYYLLLHTICSFFADEFLLWNAGIINVVFMLLTLCLVRKSVRLLTSSEVISNIAALLFCLTPGFWYNGAFLRMYVMAMFFVTWLSYVVVKQLNRNDKFFYAKVFIIAAAGALTHYYCIVYCVFISAAYGIFLLIQKQYLKLVKFGGAMIMAGGVSLAVFPSMLRHMFAEKRGAESIQNLAQTSISLYFERVREFFTIINTDIFGGCLMVMMILAAGYLLYKVLRNRKVKGSNVRITENAVLWKYIVLLIPIVFYFLLVAKIAVYIVNRYMFPIYAVVFVTFISLFFSVVGNWLHNRTGNIIMAGTGVLLVIGGLTQINPSQLYLVAPAIQDVAAEYADTDCIYVYDMRWKTMSSFMEVPLYRSITFVAEDNLEILTDAEIKGAEELMVLISGENAESILADILQKFDHLSSYEQIGGHGYSKTYHVY